ncbi:MAG: hypothetical protein HQ572_00565 [Candidatus Omnitrophica bacterium]|nr:hypothetical protein [Candidatus Omnitrophota bacterium]
MNKRFLAGILILLICMNSVGCGGAWRRKFIRRKKGEEATAPVLQPKDYEKEFTNKQFYANHFVFWKNSESELISSIQAKKSQKRIEMFASYSLTEIKKIYELLIEDKQKELEPYIDELERLVEKIKTPNYLISHKNRVVKEISSHYRAVNKFSYFYMKNFVIPDEVQENSVAQEEKVKEPDAEDLK